MSLLPFLLLAPVMVAVAYFDLRYMKIPNLLVIAAIGIFVATSPLLGWPELGVRMITAGVVLAIGFMLFAFNMFGGGDVKMLAALMLFVPSQSHTLFALVLAAAMLTGIGIIVGLRMVPVFRRSTWVSLQQHGTFPMGISIAMAGLCHPLAMHAVA